MHSRAFNRRPFIAPTSEQARYAMLMLAITCQLITIVITWPLWQARDHPVNLPLHGDLPELSFGWAMIASLVVAAARPKFGVAIHWIVLITACVFDQFRLEPQFFGLATLMLAYFGNVGLRVCRWYLVAMWIWTGLHKFLSSEWMGHDSWTLVTQAGLPPEQVYLPFAVIVATTEVTLGLLACFRPRWASGLCVAVHLGIVLFMSPLLAGMNYSVVPWNLGIACIGYWVLQQSDPVIVKNSVGLPRWEKALLAVLMVVPLGFYVGWVDRCFCHVMYSGDLPHGLITNKDGSDEVQGWGDLAVPFPSERRLFRLYFEKNAQRGDKLHISDPRWMLADQFFVMRSNGAEQIDADEFFRFRTNEVIGVALDHKQSLFALSRAGVTMLRESEQSMVYAVAFTPQNFDRSLLRYLEGLPNLQQLQFSGTDIQDHDLGKLKTLRLLTGLGLNHTQISDEGLSQLDDLPYLRYVEIEGTTITQYGSD